MVRVYDVAMPRRRDLQSEIEELFSELWQVPRFAGRRTGFRPRVDCYSTESEITVLMELPGVDPACVRIHATPTALVVSGERPRPRVPGAVYQLLEIDHGPFERTLRFGEEVDVEASTAAYRDGLLRIVLPLARTSTGPVSVPIELKAES